MMCVYVCVLFCARAHMCVHLFKYVCVIFLHDMCTCLCVRLFKHVSMMYVSYVSLFTNVLHKDFFLSQRAT